MTCIFVVGTGRSGTSLTMQALGTLGVRLPDDPVPAGPANLRGTGESIALRDRLRALDRSLGKVLAFRPKGWMEAEASRETVAWIADYLARQDRAAGGGAFAMKFPLSALFLPLFFEASKQAGTELAPVWSTRSAAGTLASYLKNYDMTKKRAVAIWAQRNYYLLQDLPGHTLLFPYEGWSEDPEAQVAALAALVDAAPEARADAARVFEADLQHAPEAKDDVLPICAKVARDLDGHIVGRRGPLQDALARNTPPFREVVGGLRGVIGSLRAENGSRWNRSEMEAELTEARTELGELRASHETLRTAYRNLSAEHDALEERVEARMRHRVGTVETQLISARARLKTTREAEADMRRRLGSAEAQLTSARAKLKTTRDAEARVRDRLGSAEAQLASTRAKLEAARESVAVLRDSKLAGERKISAARAQNVRLEAFQAELLSSTSWRITAPIRYLRRLMG